MVWCGVEGREEGEKRRMKLNYDVKGWGLKEQSLTRCVVGTVELATHGILNLYTNVYYAFPWGIAAASATLAGSVSPSPPLPSLLVNESFDIYALVSQFSSFLLLQSDECCFFFCCVSHSSTTTSSL